jgi:outer membrane protein
MTRILHFCTLLLLALLSAQAGAQPLKIGYVNTARIESESAMARQSAEALKNEFAPREKQLQEMQKQGNDLQADLEKNGAKMQPAERQAKEKRIAALLQQFQQAQRALVEEVEARKRESFAIFIGEVNGIIKNIAEAGNYDLIIQQAVYSGAQVDITEQVLKEIAKRSASTAK